MDEDDAETHARLQAAGRIASAVSDAFVKEIKAIPRATQTADVFAMGLVMAIDHTRSLDPRIRMIVLEGLMVGAGSA